MKIPPGFNSLAWHKTHFLSLARMVPLKCDLKLSILHQNSEKNLHECPGDIRLSQSMLYEVMGRCAISSEGGFSMCIVSNMYGNFQFFKTAILKRLAILSIQLNGCITDADVLDCENLKDPKWPPGSPKMAD